MSNLVAEYVAHRVRMGEYSDVSVKHVTKVLNQWHRWAGDPPWTTDRVGEWVHDERLRPNSRKVRLARLRPYCAWLLSTGRIATDPTVGVARVRIPAPAPRDLNSDQVRRLIAVCPDARAVLIVQLMVQCGLRRGDVARIRIEDIDARRRYLLVRAKGGRGDGTHWVPIPSEAWDLIVAKINRLGRSAGPLIESKTTPGAPIGAHHLGELVRGWLRKAQVKQFPYDGVSAHSLRHTCATDLIERGADIRQVQAVLGHRYSTTTEGYVRRAPTGLAEVMEGRRYLDAA